MGQAIGIDERLFDDLTKYCNESDNLEDNLRRAELLGFGGREVKVAPGAIIRVRDKSAIGRNIFIGLHRCLNFMTHVSIPCCIYNNPG